AARVALAALDRAEWQRALPPVLVLHESGAIEVTLPVDTAEFLWHIALEEGGERSGKLSFGDLRLLAEHRLDGRALQRRSWTPPGDMPWGYHRLSIELGGASTTLIVTPR